MTTVPCPKCGRPLAPAGEVTVRIPPCGEQTFPTYQCDECLRTVQMFGEPVEIALTFCVDEQGRPFDPAEPDGKLTI